MRNSPYENSRPNIPADLERKVKTAAGHACSVQHCHEHTYLELHHIDENRENNTEENIILLCDKHHKMAHEGVIDRKSLREYKRLLVAHRVATREALVNLLCEIFGVVVGMQIATQAKKAAYVVLNPATVEELMPYVRAEMLTLSSNNSMCAMGANNSVGNDFEDLKRPYGIGIGYFLSCVGES